jgi:hypothetical protein
VLLDQGHPLQFARVSGEAGTDFRQETVVNFVDYLDVARQDVFEEPDRPLLQGFGKNGVVGVGESPGGDIPGRVPL